MKKETCPAKKLLETLSQPHMLALIHTLADGVWGFNQLQQVTKINSRTFTLRLQLLQTEKIIERIDCLKDGRCSYYRLSVRGKKVNRLLKQLDSI